MPSHERGSPSARLGAVRRLTRTPKLVVAALAMGALLSMAVMTTASAASQGLLKEGFESGLGPFTATVATGVAGDAWARVTTNPHSGAGSAYAPDPSHVADTLLTFNGAIHVPAGNTTDRLSFFHSYNLDSGFDGGVVERSVDGGPFGDFATAEYLQNGPNGLIDVGNPNLGGRKAWTGSTGGSPPAFVQTIIDLAPYAGHDVTFRFRLASDSSGGNAGWWIDDIDAGVPPEAITGDATSVSRTTATINGEIRPHSTEAGFHIEYGPTSSYGAAAPTPDTPVGSDDTSHPVSQGLVGLAPATTYHYRVVATFAGGTAPGSDRTFTTASDLGSPMPFGGIAVPRKTLTVKHGKVSETLGCPANAVDNCVGTTTLRTAGKVVPPKLVAAKKKAKILTLGRGTFSIPAGKTRKVTIKLSNAALKLLARKHTLKGKQTIVAHDSRNTSKTTTGSVTLKAAKKRNGH
jgi:hypothetical protein